MIELYLTDPGFAFACRSALAFVFLTASYHKLKAPIAFKNTLTNYRLLPERLLTPAAHAIVAFELLAVAGLLANSRFGSGVASGLLIVYTLAISINLLRGRRDIDCGCSGPGIRQTLSGWLVLRNTGLLALALLTLPAGNPRPLNLLDGFTTLAAVTTFASIYTAASCLSAAGSRFAPRLRKSQLPP
jgi:hypothetical protein